MKYKLVSISEIAEIFGVGRTVVGNWKVRYPDFPAPYDQLRVGDIWLEKDVIAWGRKVGRLKNKPKLKILRKA